jgi:hypothetical protein
MNDRKFKWAAIMLCLTVCVLPMAAVAQSGNPLQDLWNNLQDLQDPDNGAFPYADIIQSDPVCIGNVTAGPINGIDRALWHPAGSVAPDRMSDTITINGRNAIIHIDQDRSDALVAGYSFQFEITQITNQNGIVFSKVNLWDNWPILKTKATGSTLETHFDVGDGTEVVGVIHASTLARPGVPSKRCVDGQFKVIVQRDPNCMAVGSFSIPFFPISILYAPSPGEEGKTKVEYVDEHSVTTKVSSSILNEQSETVPADYTGLGTLNSVMTGLQAVGTAVGVLNPAAGAIVKKCVDIFKEGLGTSEGSEESGTKAQTVNDTLLLNSSLLGQVVGGENDDGSIAQPGKDDRIVLLRGVRMAWIGDGGKNPTLVSLGSKQLEIVSVKKVANDIGVLEAVEPAVQSTGPADSGHVGDLEFGQSSSSKPTGKGKDLISAVDSRAIQRIHSVVKELEGTDEQLTDIHDLETLRSLFILDPLAYFGPDVDFSQPHVRQQYHDRFQVAFFQTQCGLTDELNTEFPTDYKTVTMTTLTQSQTGTQFQASIQDDKPGWFGKYFLGYTTKKTKVSSTLSGTVGATVSNSKQIKIHWERSSDAIVLTAFYDCLFGTYIFREVPNTYRQTSGVATDDDGNPLIDQLIKFEINGKSVLARTDKNGRYTVYSSNAVDGRGKLTVGRKVMTMDVTPMRKKKVR